ncbi:hypothetical protein EIP86_010450 [Pleurotus ostreatoroseus]|nr:hypothetical protein EIP86_010450 [Pleurotus ostreatoroseus]
MREGRYHAKGHAKPWAGLRAKLGCEDDSAFCLLGRQVLRQLMEDERRAQIAVGGSDEGGADGRGRRAGHAPYATSAPSSSRPSRTQFTQAVHRCIRRDRFSNAHLTPTAAYLAAASSSDPPSAPRFSNLPAPALARCAGQSEIEIDESRCRLRWAARSTLHHRREKVRRRFAIQSAVSPRGRLSHCQTPHVAIAVPGARFLALPSCPIPSLPAYRTQLTNLVPQPSALQRNPNRHVLELIVRTHASSNLPHRPSRAAPATRHVLALVCIVHAQHITATPATQPKIPVQSRPSRHPDIQARLTRRRILPPAHAAPPSIASSTPPAPPSAQHPTTRRASRIQSRSLFRARARSARAWETERAWWDPPRLVDPWGGGARWWCA